jgi:hypothetical protein
MPLNPSNNYATPYHEYSEMYRKGGDESSLSSINGPKITAGFSSCRFTESMAFGEASGCNILDRYFLNSSFFISSKKGTRSLFSGSHSCICVEPTQNRSI